MIFLASTILVGIIDLILWQFAAWGNGTANACFVFAVIGAIAFTGLSLGCLFGGIYIYRDHIDDIEAITMRRADKDIYKKKADALTEEFKTYLVEMYPKHEKAIIEKVFPDNLQLLGVVLPEIKASDTIKDYCKRINDLMSDVYSQDLKITTLEKNIRVRCRDITGLGRFLPKE